MKSILKKSVISVAKNVKFLRETAHFISNNTSMRDGYTYLKNSFINNGREHRINEEVRTDLVRQFELIDQNVQIASSPTDGLILAELLLNVESEGSMIECGCFSGGSTAKLSIIAKILDRNLIVFDSFEGLPEVTDEFLRDHHCRRNEEWVKDWTKGRYEARIDLVKENVEKYGDPTRTRFIKGWFNETLTAENLPKEIAFAFCDVDLANSARDCLKSIWPRLNEKGIFVTHDTAYIKVLQELYSPKLWRDELKSIPPILFGAGFGIYNSSPHIGYMVKGDGLNPEYLKSLTIDK